MDRVYGRVPDDGPVKIDEWLEALKKGRTFATNAPLLDFSLGGEQVGGEVKLAAAHQEVPFTATLRSIVPVDHLEVVCNGRVVQPLSLNAARDSLDAKGVLPLTESGWCVLRASSDRSEYPVLDSYVYATTSPIYVTIDGKKPRSSRDAKYFVAWMDRVIAMTERYPDWNSGTEKDSVLSRLKQARTIYERLQ